MTMRIRYRTHRFDPGQEADAIVVTLPNGRELRLSVDMHDRLQIEADGPAHVTAAGIDVDNIHDLTVTLAKEG